MEYFRLPRVPVSALFIESKQRQQQCDVPPREKKALQSEDLQNELKLINCVLKLQFNTKLRLISCLSFNE